MTQEDRDRWERRYAGSTISTVGVRVPLSRFAPYEHLFPTEGFALEIACGLGIAAVWLARRGMTVCGLDVSPTAIQRASELAAVVGVSDHCRFDIADLDAGLPGCGPADLILCHNFRDTRLYAPIIDRLAPGGLLAIATLSEVDAEPSRFRAKPGELRQAFGTLDIIFEGEGDGQAWLLGRRQAFPKSCT